MIIYKATNQVNGKVYIGQTVNNLGLRKYYHLYNVNNGSNLHFHNALRKHGEDSFVWQIMNECHDIDTLNQLERYYIKYYDSMDRDIGYNMTSGGERYECSDEVKQKYKDAWRDTDSGFRKTKIDEPTVRAIRIAYACGQSITSIAKDLKMSPSHIEKIVSCMVWTDVA